MKFVNRISSLGTMDIVFDSEKIAKKYVNILITVKLKLFPMYMGQKIVRLRVSAIDPEIKVEWVAGL